MDELPSGFLIKSIKWLTPTIQVTVKDGLMVYEAFMSLLDRQAYGLLRVTKIFTIYFLA